MVSKSESSFLVLFAKDLISKLPERFTSEDVSPDRLACLFMLKTMVGPHFPEFHRVLTDLMLDYTIRRAMDSSPWYKEAYSKTAIPSNRRYNVQDLIDLPVFDRNDLAQAREKFHSTELNFGFATFTSGTTSFNPTILDISFEEQVFVSKFFKIIQQKKQDQKHDIQIGLNLANSYHGHLIEIPTAFRSIEVSLNSMSGLRTAQNLLRRKYATSNGPQQVSAIGGALISLLRLTAFLEGEQFQKSCPPIEFIQSTSEYMTPKARRTLQGFWNCPIEDRYGLSEIFIGAWRCQVCGLFHFESYGIPEVVNIQDFNPITQGRGRLILTGFSPFMQMTPMIRYLTGDGVEIVDVGCQTGNVGFRLLGRLKNSLIQEERLILGEYEVMDILDEEPDVYRRKRYSQFPEHLRDIGSSPEFNLGFDNKGRPNIEIELSFDPLKFPEKTEKIKRRVTTALSARGVKACHISFKEGAEPPFYMY